jgi:hypothetical protein
VWKTAILAVDGGIVNQPEPPIIRGEAELDPPGGWEPFAILATDGSVLQ